MKKTIAAFTLATAISICGLASMANAAAPVPCEDMMKTLDEAMAKAKLSDADMKLVMDLKTKADERCKAEDDRRADGFITDALAIVNKK